MIKITSKGWDVNANSPFHAAIERYKPKNNWVTMKELAAIFGFSVYFLNKILKNKCRTLNTLYYVYDAADVLERYANDSLKQA
jgi:hypothetical protein